MNPLRGKKWDDEFWRMQTEQLANKYSRQGDLGTVSPHGYIAYDKEDQKEANRLFRRYHKMKKRADRANPGGYRNKRARAKQYLAAEKFDKRHLGARAKDHKIDFAADLLKNDPRFKDLQQPAPRF